MPGGIKNFEEDLIEAKNFHGDFDNITSVEEAHEKAMEHGYDFTIEELQNSEVLDTILECASGGINNFENKKNKHFNDINKI